MSRSFTQCPAVRRAVRLAIAASLATAVAATVHAQNAPAGDEDAPEVTEVVVTGTRIVSPNLEAISPVTAITADEISSTGKVRVEDIINQLPQAFASQGSNISNASDGTASVDLRGLGAQRTLVLVNGRRLMPGDPDGGSAADLNQIPLALVKRVDVLTGGASSVYGADAVAGVVNFVMDTDFEGIRLEANYNFFMHDNDNTGVQDIVRGQGFPSPGGSVNSGYSRDVTFALGLGGADDRGHATFYATYREVDPVVQSQFDYSSCTLNSTAAGSFVCGGSQTSVPAGFFGITPAGDLVDTANCPSSGCVIGAGGVVRPFNAATDSFNFGPYNYFQRPDERYTAGVFLNYKVADTAEAYGEFMYMDDRSVSQIAPSGAFIGSTYQVNCDNPFLPGSFVTEFCTNLGLAGSDFTSVLIGRRNLEGGGRQEDIGHDSYRIIAGLRGQLGDNWRYDAYAQHGVTKRNSTYNNDFSIVRTARALQAANDPATGTVQCLINVDTNPANDDPACVPWNIFQEGGVTPQSLTYLQTPGFQRAQARQQIFHADISGDFGERFKLPTARTGLAFNIGAEYRDERTEFTPDIAFSSGDLAGQGGATLPVSGAFQVKEGFLEARMPLVEEKTGIQALSAEAGYRYSDYTTGFTTDTYKVGLDYQPVEQLRFRGTYQRAVRAPNVGELFSSQSVALDGSTDPCAGATPQATVAQCQLTGLDPALYGRTPENPAGQYNGLLGGNSALQPEESDTYSAGFVWRPPFANLSVALDWFDIQVDDTISSTIGGNADAFINECITTGAPAVCSLINRDQLGSLWLTQNGFITDTSLNIGALKTTGIDAQVNYQFDVGGNRFGIAMVGTYLDSLENTPLPNGDSFDCVGYFGNNCGVPNPQWRHSLRATWRTPWRGLDLGLGWRYFDSVQSERTSSDSQLAGNFSPADARLPSVSYIDLTAAITFADKYTLRVGANNLLDKSPPLVGSGSLGNCPTGPCNGNTWAQVYDVLGRQVFAQVAVEF